MTTPRTTRLVRVPSLREARRVLLDCAAADEVAGIRHTAIIVPTHAAAEQLRRGMEEAAPPGTVVVLPHLLTRGDLIAWLFHHVAGAPPLLSPHEREGLLAASARAAIAGGAVPPFSVRTALVGEMLAFYDTCRRQLKTVDDVERLAVGRFERDADEDLGAARMLAQARFMVAAFRGYEQRLAAAGRTDEHLMRDLLLAHPDVPLRRVVVAVGDRAADPHGLWLADFDLLARLNGLTSLDIVATDRALAAGLIQRLREHLPGMDERTSAAIGNTATEPVPTLDAPGGESDALYHQHRDREDELAWIVRRTKAAARTAPDVALGRTAVVFKRPLPYVYLARLTFAAAGVPYEAVDALPLASEPAAAALDLVIELVGTSFTRSSIVALLRSPHYRWGTHGAEGPTATDVAVLDRELSERRFLGGPETLSGLAAGWIAASQDAGSNDRTPRLASLARAGTTIVAIVSDLAPLAGKGSPSAQLETLRDFLTRYAAHPPADEDVRSRHLRARAAVLATLASLRDACRAFDDAPRSLDETASALHRWIERQTFSPRRGGSGTVLTDAHAARFGDFDTVYLVGVTQREWPESARRSIFFPASMLKDLGWPDDADSRAAERAAFGDLLRLPAAHVIVSAFTLEDDAIVEPSPFLEDLAESGLGVRREPPVQAARIFAHEALTSEPAAVDGLAGAPASWLALRQARSAPSDPRFHGAARPAGLTSYKVSSLDRFVECPFIFFAEQVLRIREEPDDDEGLSPRMQGRLLHEVFEGFFRGWQEAGRSAIVPDNLAEARRLFTTVAEARLAAMSEGDAAIERVRFLGSPVATGLGDIVLGLEAERIGDVVERLLEFPLSGEAELRTPAGPRQVALRAVADRIDLLADGTFRVFDYKLSKPPDLKAAVQLPAYAAAARARLDGRLGRTWRASEAAYVAFAKAPYYHPLAADADKLDDVLAEGEARLADAVDRIERGEFPPQPRQKHRCTYCAFSSVCRKDYVDGE